MTNLVKDRFRWLSSIRTRVAVLALLVVALLIGCGFAFVLVLENRESTITTETERHLSSVVIAMARDYVGHEQFQKEGQELPPLDNPAAPGSDDVLALTTTAVLRSERGTEGGFYSSAGDRLLGYAFPTHEGPGVKKDIPPIERPTIEDVARRAAKQAQSVSYTYRGARDVIVFEAAPILVKGNTVGSAWVMKRLPSLRGEQNLKLSLGAASFAALSLICVLLAFLVARDLGTGVTRIESRLHELDQDFASAPKEFNGLAELGRIYRGVNQLAESLRQKIEQERDLREQLRHKERLAALGQVAAGVAHELRNPLATIRLRTQISQRAVSDPSVQKSCEMVLEEIERLNAIVEQLLYFARPLTLKVEAFNLLTLLGDCVEAKVVLTENGSIHLQLEPDSKETVIHGDRAKLRQVFDNILSNAIDAVGGAGSIRVRVRREEGSVVIDFEDDGHGIPAEIRDKLFDPFFTTRSKGTGLGLSIAYEIVRAHDGAIAIAPAPDKGTVVKVRLPIAGPAIPATPAEAIQSGKA